MKTKIKLNSPVSEYRIGREYIPGVLPPNDSRFNKALKSGSVPSEVFGAALSYRLECENSSYAAKVGDLDHIRLVQTRDLNATEKEIECLKNFIEELN